MGCFLKTLVTLGLFTSFIFGQDSLIVTSISVAEIKSTYENNRYGEVEKLIKAELERFPQQSPQRLTSLMRYLALAQASQGKDNEAQRTFASLLLIKPDHRFDTSEISPKIKRLFDKVLLDSIPSQSPDSFLPSYVIQTDRRYEYILKSILYPGWGQLEQGQKRGYLWGTLFSVALLGGGVSSYMAYRSQSEYLDTTDPEKIESAYDNFNQWYQ
ncbi:MAG: hypothetical protein L3J79_09845, partial [Candidatus Marinimicrobia bacterium]|nr:hypothetical protein [Candidatus Neomarinimicrobiota bacterium]